MTFILNEDRIVTDLRFSLLFNVRKEPLTIASIYGPYLYNCFYTTSSFLSAITFVDKMTLGKYEFKHNT